jgi:hypothetical protein
VAVSIAEPHHVNTKIKVFNSTPG